MLITILDFTGKWMGSMSSRTGLKKLEYLRQTEQPLEREISNNPRLLVIKRKSSPSISVKPKDVRYIETTY